MCSLHPNDSPNTAIKIHEAISIFASVQGSVLPVQDLNGYDVFLNYTLHFYKLFRTSSAGRETYFLERAWVWSTIYRSWLSIDVKVQTNPYQNAQMYHSMDACPEE